MRIVQSSPIAFYDLDGTLCSGNVVQRYAFYARNHPSKLRAILRYSRLAASVPVFLGLELYSRRIFNEVFYREYRGMKHEWLSGMAEELFERAVRPTIYAGAKALVDADKAQGFRTVLVTGELDFAVGPIARHFGFDKVITNSLLYRHGSATGRVKPPLIAEKEKAAAIRAMCDGSNGDLGCSKAYSDSISDLYMLEAVGRPAAVNPDRRLKRLALRRGWLVLDLKNGNTRPHL